MPDLIVLAGPNGSGKTTLSSYLVDKGKIKGSLINPDQIAKDEFGAYSFQIKASKLALHRRKEAITNQEILLLKRHFQATPKYKILKLLKHPATGLFYIT